MRDLDRISKYERDLMQSLVNPDSVKERRYRFDSRYQQEVLAMLLMDKIFLIQSMQLIKPNYFGDKAHETICDILFTYFTKYKQMPPKFVIVNEIRQRFPEEDKKVLMYAGELEALTSGYIPGLESREACLDKITEFAREQALRSAVSTTLDILEKNPEDKWAKIEELFKKALLVNRNFDPGLDYFLTLDDRYERMAQYSFDKEVFVTGFRGIDVDGLSSGGICRGEIAAYTGSSGAGKSLLLVKAGVQNVVRGKKVLYISLEMDEDKLAKRFDAMLSLQNIRVLLDQKDAVLAALREQVANEEDKSRLIIKQFPAGTADVQMLKAYLSQLELHGWKPDMICVDYVGEFKDHEGIKTYESRQRIVRDLRALAVEYNVAVFTAMQANRRSKEEDEVTIDDSMLADSFGQARVLDALWSINQSAREKDQGVGKIFVIKHRDGRSRYRIFFKQNRDTLDLQEISSEEHGRIMSEFTVKNTDKVDVPMLPSKKKFRPNNE